MSTPKPQNEPTMEEILASIRKIISEDAEAPAKPAETPAAAVPAAPAAPPPAAQPAPPSLRQEAASAPQDESVLELTDMVKDDGSVEKLKQPSEELVMTDTPEPEPTPAPAQASRPGPTPESELLSSQSAAAAATALAGLAGVRTATRGLALGDGQKTIEDIVRELLRPMLKDWLDSNLPPLVERLVQREITKLAGLADDR
jgi:uncharacterized protein